MKPYREMSKEELLALKAELDEMCIRDRLYCDSGCFRTADFCG